MGVDKYEHENKVWYISDWNYPIDPEGLEDAFFWRVMNCWDWATWADRWQYFEKAPEKFINNWDKEKYSILILMALVTSGVRLLLIIHGNLVLGQYSGMQVFLNITGYV